MAKSRRKKNYKLRRRVMRTVAALTMVMAIVVAAIPVENYGTMQAADGRAALGDISTELDNSGQTPAHYGTNGYNDESDYSGNTATVQRIVESDGGGSFIDVFRVQKKSSGTEAIIIEDIIGDGLHGSETTLEINSTEYCDYVQFDAAFIEDITTALGQSSFDLEFGSSSQTYNPEGTPPSGSTLPGITVKTISTENPTDSSVNVSISINNNANAQGYTGFPNLSSLSSKTIYEQEFGKGLYDGRTTAISTYNQEASALVTDISNFNTRVSGTNYTWQGSDTTAWNGFVDRANALSSRHDSLKTLSTSWMSFDNTDSGLNSIVDYIIRTYCRSGQKNLLSFRLKGLTKRNASGDTESVYVPQWDGVGQYTGQLDDKNYLAASTSVQIRGIASYAENGNRVFHNTHLRTVVLPQGIQFIGKQAFGASDLENVTLNATTCKIVGEEAFAGCSRLKSVNFTFSGNDGSNSFMAIDKKAFYSTALTSVRIPYSVTIIGAGAFANATELTEVVFDDTGRRNDINIEKFAFYNCVALTKVEFPGANTQQYKIGKGAFAVENPGGSLENFVFPGGNTDIIYGNSNSEADYDHILANRNTLKTVTFPGGLKTKVPDNTLSGCNNLSYVVFPDNARNATYSPEALFADVWGDPGFYVEGPATLDTPSSYAKPREDTWKAKAGKTGQDTWALTSVPYKFTDAAGKVHFEIGVSDSNGNLEYIANIEEIDKDNKLASLISYFLYDQTADPKNVWIKIPTTVGEYKIVSIEAGCFDGADKLKNNVTRLSIGDGISDIKDGAFKDMPALQWVDIGSGVTNIGREAFAGCENLENVVFSQALTSTWSEDNVEYWRELKIADDAFKTNSTRLTFHGAVNPEYAPFKLAMSLNNSDLLKRDIQICYKTDAPLNLTIIRNRNDNRATLVNYPHYEDMDTDIVQAFEAVYINGSGTESDREKLDSDAGRAIVQTLKMELPKGIESIDSKSFFGTGSGNNLDYEYINGHYEQKENNADGTPSQVKSDYQYTVTNEADKPVNGTTLSDKRDLQSLYSLDGKDYVDDELYAQTIGDTAYVNNDPERDRIVSTGGLFSGGFRESTQTLRTDGVIWTDPYEGHTYKEDYTSGNDYLTSINMRGVKDLPKYAFDSCENLLTVTFNAVESMGDLPFRGCKNLYQINTGASKYAFENLLLYERKDDGSTEIIECLEGRGRGNGDNGQYYYTGSITGTGEDGANVDSMISTVTSIREGAFSNCKNITTVDLDASKVDRIPQRAFENCTNLWQVKLPEATRAIDQKAFKGAADRDLYVEIRNPDCTIAVDAFDFKTTKEVFIKGISTNYKGEESTCHLNYEQIKNELEKSGIDGNRIHWSELGSTCILTFEDDIGTVIERFEVNKGESLRQPPVAPAKTGWDFDYWICTGVRDENGNPLTGEATYSNVTEDRTIRAMYKQNTSTIVPDGKDYNLTVVNGYAMIGGSMVTTFPTVLKGGTSVTIIGSDEANFRVWTIVPGNYISSLLNPSSRATSFTMPNADITVTANSATGGGTDTPNPDGTYTVTVNNGTGGGNYRPGVTVTITANTPPTGQSFTNWTTTTTGVTLANVNSNSTTFVMPSSNVTVTANFSGGNQGGNNQGGNTGDNNNNNNATKYKVTVNYGSGSGEYAAGETVNITANAPESSSRVFSRWTTNNSGLGFANANAVSTSFVMPAADVTVTANYRVRTDDDDDDDSPSRRPGTNTNTSTVPNRPGSSTTTTGTNGTVNNPSSGTTNNNNGNRIYITKNGISNTDVASLAVNGSTDNFIVRITESPEATAAVEQALTNTYGSLNGLAYLPMDISLYDSTGQNKITDSTGLNITVTMPIPDVLIQYGGNARVAAADNGNLQQITPRFTTIDGIACVSFVPPHFSPYVIYVDTNNLIAGQMLDSTPATGDPIHPKWFAAIGMACVSILLFVMSDGRKRRKYRAA